MSASPETLLSLAERVEAASGADRELDALIAEIALGARNVTVRDDGSGHMGFESSGGPLPWWTASIDDAARFVPKGHTWATGDCGEENIPWACVTQNAEPCRDFSADAATPALALTAAALRAHASQSQEPSK